jgi:anion-transporting  ArsA/GET3 family ATPase
MAEFITELNDLFGGFKQRAGIVEAALRSREVSFVLVTSPAPMSIKEVLFFSERLEEAKMPRGAFVVNRFRVPPPGADAPPSLADAAEALARDGMKLEEDAPARLLHAHSDAVRLASLDALHVKSLDGLARGKVPIVRVPELASDVHDLGHLGEVAEVLMRGGV